MRGSGAKLWGNLAIMQFIDSNIADERNIPKEEDVGTHENWGEVAFRPGSFFFNDMMFFVRKGVKFKYVHRIFIDLKKAGATELPATDTEGKMKGAYGANQYSASASISLYDHIVNTAKAVYELKGEYSRSQQNNAALLVLFHDMGKISKYLRENNKAMAVSSDHDKDSAKYAALVMTDEGDAELLELFEDCLKNKSLENRKYGKTSPCQMLQAVDYADRVKTENKVFEAGVNRNDS